MQGPREMVVWPEQEHSEHSEHSSADLMKYLHQKWELLHNSDLSQPDFTRLSLQTQAAEDEQCSFTYQKDPLKLWNATCKNYPILLTVWIPTMRTVHINGEIQSQEYMLITGAFRYTHECEALWSLLFYLFAHVESFSIEPSWSILACTCCRMFFGWTGPAVLFSLLLQHIITSSYRMLHIGR